MSKKLFAGAAVTLAMALPASMASAATYVSKLEYSSAGYTATPFGTVTIEEVDANTVTLTVALTDIDLIVDTGNHVAFAFGLADEGNDTSVVTVLDPVSGYAPQLQADGPYTNPPFGNFTNAVTCCGHGASDGIPPPLKVQIYNVNGLTFLGSGNKFKSNTDGSVGNLTGGWWFAVDTFDRSRPNGGNTFAVAARDVNCISGCGGGIDGGVPEPGTWALMIMGFGGAGAMLRRRRTALV